MDSRREFADRQHTRSSLRLRLCLLILIVYPLTGAAYQVYVSLWVAGSLSVAADGRRWVSETVALEQHFGPLKPHLPDQGRVGYLALLDLDDEALERRFMKVGYLLSPLHLIQGAEPTLVVADVHMTKDVEALCRQHGLVALLVFDDGPALLTHPGK